MTWRVTTNGQTRFVLAALGAGVLCFLVAAILLRNLAPFGAATTPDSMGYLEGAANVRAGHGLALNSYRLPPGSPFKAFTYWPPLYPVTLAMVPARDDTGVNAARRFSVAALALSALLLFLLLRPYTGAPLALLASLVFEVAPSTQTVFAHAWSETLFTPLVLAACGCLFRCLLPSAPGRRSVAFPLLLTACLAALIACRYAGAVFAVWLPVAWYAFWRRPRAAIMVGLSAMLYAGTVGFLALRNYRLSGDPAGLVLPASHKGVLTNAGDLAASFSLLVPGQVWIAALVTLGVFALCLAAGRARKVDAADAPRVVAPAGRLLLAVSLLFAAEYLVGMIALRTAEGFDPLYVRAVAPVVPVLLAALAVGAALAWERRRTCRWSVWAAAACLTLLMMPAVQGVVRYKAVAESAAHRGQPTFVAAPGVWYKNHTWPRGQDRTGWLNGRTLDAGNAVVGAFESLDADGQTTFVTEHPQVVHFVSGAEAWRIPEGRITPRTLATLNAISGRAFLLLVKPESVQRFDAALGGRLESYRLALPYLPTNWFVARLPLEAVSRQ